MDTSEKLDPFRPAENWHDCPQCGGKFGWNSEDGLAGQKCLCGYQFTERDARTYTRDRVMTAVNAGADLARDGLDLGDRDADLINIVVNAIGYALDHPDVTELDDVLNANWQLGDEFKDDDESRPKTAAEWVRSWHDW